MHESQSFENMFVYDLKSLGSPLYDGDVLDSDPVRITLGNETAISMAKCNKDTGGNRHISRNNHYVR